ncbi:hypothetical protein GF314_14665, partial [bacterium]|nr:hypothetical protein [bacterium]
MSIRSVLVVVGLLALAVAGPAVAARYHVAPGGTRTADASEPGDWSAENCYPTLAAAAAQTAPADSVLLSRDQHGVTSTVAVPAFLGNRDLDTDPTGCVLVLTGAGEVRVREASVSVVIAGLRWTSDGQAREATALAIANPGGGLEAVSITGCEFNGLVGGRSLGGAGVYAEEGRGLALTVRACGFVDNDAPGRGGAMAIRDGFIVHVEDSEFRRNRAIAGGTSPLGGAIYVSSPDEPTSVTILGTDFLGNESARAGGALCIFDASLELDQCRVIGSRSASTGIETWAAGAGLMLRRYDGTHLAPVALVIRGCRFEDNVGNLAAGTGAG